jgi:hypothetical protein
MTVLAGSDDALRQGAKVAGYTTCSGSSVMDRTAALRARDADARAVRRRVLEVQLSRLLSRVQAGGPSAADAAVRAERLAARLECDELEW